MFQALSFAIKKGGRGNKREGVVASTLEAQSNKARRRNKV